MAWNLSNDRPLYQQAAEIIRSRILQGTYKPGEKLPPVRELAMEAGVNPNTMQKAMTALEESGILYSQSTSGRFVTDEAGVLDVLKKHEAKQRIRQFITDMYKIGYQPEEILDLIRSETEV